MAVKKALSKELSDLISKYLSKGGKVKKLPAGKAKNADEKANVKPKNLPRDKQGKTLKFDADGEVKFKDGGMTKKKKEEFKDKGFYEYLDDVMNKKPKPKTKAKDKTKNKGVKIKNGGTLRVSKRGPLYKGKKSGPYS